MLLSASLSSWQAPHLPSDPPFSVVALSARLWSLLCGSDASLSSLLGPMTQVYKGLLFHIKITYLRASSLAMGSISLRFSVFNVH